MRLTLPVRIAWTLITLAAGVWCVHSLFTLY